MTVIKKSKSLNSLGDVGGKVAMDDLTVAELKACPSEEFKTFDEQIENSDPKQLPFLIKELQKMPYFEAATYASTIAKNTGIPKRDIIKAIKGNTGNSKPDEDGLEPKAIFDGLIDVVADKDGTPEFLIKSDNEFLITKQHESYCPPPRDAMPFHLASSEQVLSAIKVKDDHQLFADIITYLSRFSTISDDQRILLACYVVLTYLQDFPSVLYLPMLFFYAVAERGKTKTSKAVLSIAWRGVHLTDLRETNVFRFAENLLATLFFDVSSFLKKCVKNGSEDVLLGRFEKGCTVARVLYPEKGAFKDTHYFRIFGPTLIATNETVSPTVRSRCIVLTTPNAPGNYEDPTPEKGLELKARLVAFRARFMGTNLPEANPIEGVTGRLWDISKPLLQVCRLLYPEGLPQLEMFIRSQAQEKQELLKDSIDGRIIEAITMLAGNMSLTNEIKTQGVLHLLNIDKQEKEHISSQYLSRRLTALSIKTVKKGHGGYSHIVMTSQELDTLRTQYGLVNVVADSSGTHLTNTNTHHQENAHSAVITSLVGCGEVPDDDDL